MNELLNWLNKDIGLSKTITSIDQDFASGYLLGELLSKFQLQPNFHLFSMKNSVREQIGNFALLGPTMKGLNIEYNAKVFDGIMRQERGAAIKLLTQIKMALDKRQKQLNSSVVIDQTRPSLKPTASLVQIRPGREGYIKMTSLLLQSKKTPNKLMMSQKSLDLENRIASFVRFQAKSLEKALAREEKERETQIKQRDERRNSMLRDLRRQRSEKEESRDKSIQNWEKSLRVRIEREQKERDFQEKVVMKIRREELEMRKQERKEMLRSIDDFESFMKDRGFSKDVEKGVEQES